MTRQKLLALVTQAINELDDPSVCPVGESGMRVDEEGRFFEVVGLFESIDWDVVPVDAIRKVFAAIVEHVPLKYTTGPGARGQKYALLTEARSSIESNADLRMELQGDDEQADLAVLASRRAA